MKFQWLCIILSLTPDFGCYDTQRFPLHLTFFYFLVSHPLAHNLETLHANHLWLISGTLLMELGLLHDFFGNFST